MATIVQFLPVSHCVKARITAIYQGYNSTLMNTLSFRTPGTPTDADCAAVAGFVANWINGYYAGQVCPAVHFTALEVESREEQFGPKFTQALDRGGTATGTDDVDPGHAPLLLLDGASRGRSSQGRFYAFTPVLEVVHPNGYSTDHMTGLVGIMNGLSGNATTAGYPLVVASQLLGTTVLVNGITHSNRLTIQKRRRPNFGR